MEHEAPPLAGVARGRLPLVWSRARSCGGRRRGQRRTSRQRGMQSPSPSLARAQVEHPDWAWLPDSLPGALL